MLQSFFAGCSGFYPHASPRLLRHDLLLLSFDATSYETRLNAGDSSKWERRIENKRHTNAHQPSPPTHQLGVQSHPLRRESAVCGDQRPEDFS
jgi:hypothetical protein